MNDVSPQRRVAAEALERYVAGIFRHAGIADDHAAHWAKSLVEANLRGVDSHGVQRVPRYLDLIRLKQINARPAMNLLFEDGALALLDADRAPGPIGMSMAMSVAIRRARDVHVGWCVARDITHAGMIRQYVEMAADAGMIGLAMTASGPLMAYHGSKGPVVSTNPLAIGVPTKGRPHLILDIATSVASLGKILAASKAGKAIPGDWGLAADGSPTTDPSAVKTLMPMSGPKGSGLSLMIEVLASIAAGNGVLVAALAGATGTRMNGVAIAVDAAALGTATAFTTGVAELAEAIAAQPAAPGVEKLLLPGERGDAIKRERAANGIPIPPSTWNELADAAFEAGQQLVPTRQ